MSTPISLWLVEDDRQYRQAFGRLIEASSDFVLKAAFESYEELVSAHSTEPLKPPPDLVVMDLNLPGLSGLKAISNLRRRYRDLAVVVLSSADAADSVLAAIRSGARGYVVKGTRPKSIINALREAHQGGTYFSPSVARHVLGHFTAPPDLDEALSQREIEVLRELSAGGSKAVIARRLFLSTHTVDTHMRNIYLKLHVRTAAEAAAKGVRSGLV